MNQDPILLSARQQQARLDQQQALIQGIVHTSAIQIYAKLVGDEADRLEACPSANNLRRMAKVAVTAAPFIAEAMGLIKVSMKEDSGDVV